MFRKAESITKPELLEHYLQKPDATVITACASLNCSYRVFRDALAAHGLVPKDKTRKFGADIRSPLLSNRDWFSEQLKTKTLSEIGRIAGRTRNIVHRWRVKHGLPAPPRIRAAQSRVKHLTREQIETVYSLNEDATICSAARAIGVCEPVLVREMRRLGVPSKPRSRHSGRRTQFPKLHDTDWLRSQLETRTLSDVAKEIGTTASNVRQQALRQRIISPPDGTNQAMKDGIKKAGKDRRGPNGSNWKGGRHCNKQTGYVSVYAPDHPHRRSNNQVFEHRLVMEKYLGRHLDPTEVVHHKNGIKNDNRIENLELVESTGKHVSEHFKKSHRVHELEEIIAQQAARIAELESRLSDWACRREEVSSH